MFQMDLLLVIHQVGTDRVQDVPFYAAIVLASIRYRTHGSTSGKIMSQDSARNRNKDCYDYREI